MRVIKSLEEAIDLAVEHQGVNEYYEANFTVTVMGTRCKVHEISVCNRDILCMTDNGTVSYLVDTIGFDNIAVIHDWSFDDELELHPLLESLNVDKTAEEQLDEKVSSQAKELVDLMDELENHDREATEQLNSLIEDLEFAVDNQKTLAKLKDEIRKLIRLYK